jgi:hypothetical protein
MLRKSLIPCVAVAALAFLIVDVHQANAQGRGGRGGMRGGFGPQGVDDITVAGNANVQKEINVKDEQKEKLKDLSDDIREEFMSAMSAGGGRPPGGGQDATPEERAKMQAKFAEIRKTINEKFHPKLAEILDKDQMKRVHEIAIQAAGAHALLDADVQKDLAITADQKEKLTTISKDIQKQLASVPRAERMTKMQELNEEATAKSNEVLTKDQQEKFASLKGKPFDTKLLRPTGGGRRARGNLGGGGNN